MAGCVVPLRRRTRSPTSARCPRRGAPREGWLLALVACELLADRADAPAAGRSAARLAGGLLRELTAGEAVGHIPPGPDPVVARADLAGCRATIVDRGVEIGDLTGFLRAMPPRSS